MKKLAALSLILAAASACTIVPAEKKVKDGDGTKPPAGAETKPGEEVKPGEQPGAETPAGEGKSRTGFVSLSQTSFQAGPTTINSFTALAGFSEAAAAGAGTADTSCKSTTDAECTILECDAPAAQDPADPGAPAEPVNAPHAGNITVAAAQTVELAADDKGAYAFKTGQTALWAAGDDINIKAAGATVPAFDKTLKAPASVTVTTPAWPAAGAALDLDRAKELALVWTGGVEGGDVTVSLSSLANGKLASITCKYPSKDNKGTISAAAMGKLIATDTGSISISGSSTEAFEAEGWKINVMASAPAKAGASLASGVAKIK